MSESDYFYGAVLWAVGQGITTGAGNTSQPHRKLHKGAGGDAPVPGASLTPDKLMG